MMLPARTTATTIAAIQDTLLWLRASAAIASLKDSGGGAAAL